jgi:hypothetical protein
MSWNKKIEFFAKNLLGVFTWKYYGLALFGTLFGCSQSIFRDLLNRFFVSYIQFDYGVVSACIILAFSIWCSYKLYMLFVRKYNFSDKFISFLIFLSATIISYRFINDGHYIYVPLFRSICYVDVLWFFSLLFVIEGITNRLRLHPKEDPKDSEISNDVAIDNPSMDKLNYYREALNIVNKIKSLPYSRSSSIAILSPWGYGKTSFINLIQHAIEYGGENSKPMVDCEIIKFNPRQSRSVRAIQEEFFSTLVESLRKYDSTISSQINQYISTIGLYISNPIATFFSSFFIKDNEELKKGIGNILRKLDKRIVVFIDDLDRLTGEEIMEVLKLIDRNAAFSNLIFITAFDPEFVDNALSKYTSNANMPFIDKFFNIRLHLPIRSPYMVINLLYKLLCEHVKMPEVLLSIMKNNRTIFISYIRNIREVKNFCNQFIVDYTPEVANQVYLSDFLLLELIKFQYYDEYYCLSQHKYLTDTENFTNLGNYVLDEKYREDKEGMIMPKSINIMRILFHTVEDGKGYPYQSIHMKRFFDVYFTNNIIDRIPIPDLDALFSLKNNSDIMSRFQEWKNLNILDDVRDYIRFMPWNNMPMKCGLSKKESFKQFLNILFLYSAFTDDKDLNIGVIQLRVLYKLNFENDYNGLKEGEYHDFLLKVIYKENYHHCPISFLEQLINLLLNPSEQMYKDMVENCILTVEDVKRSNLSLFNQYLQQMGGSEYSELAQRLYQLCIDHISNNIYYHLLNANKNMYDFILKDKKYKYLSPFYHKEEANDFIQFSMHPFCKEIFSVGDDENDNFVNYVNSSKIGDIQKRLILLYWNRYKDEGSQNFGYYKKVSAELIPSDEEIINNLKF